MALPEIKTLQDCADFSKVVAPFIPDLFALPSRVRATGLDGAALAQLYAETNPLVTAAAASVVLGFVFWATSEVNRNYSQVDRAWSVLPALYVGHLSLWARAAGRPHDRIDVVAVFAGVWATRLTYNYWRKGGYSVGSEDYRW
jgi:steroid 5-alpha reductase family enzyme